MTKVHFFFDTAIHLDHNFFIHLKNKKFGAISTTVKIYPYLCAWDTGTVFLSHFYPILGQKNRPRVPKWQNFMIMKHLSLLI